MCRLSRDGPLAVSKLEPLVFLVPGEESVQKALHRQQRGDPHSCANGRGLSQIQDYRGQREVGAREQRDRLVNQVLPCEHKSLTHEERADAKKGIVRSLVDVCVTPIDSLGWVGYVL